MKPDYIARIEGLLSAAVNRLLALDPDTMVGLKRLHSRAIALRLRDFDSQLVAVVEHEQVRLYKEFGGVVDVVMVGNVNDFVALLRANKRGESIAAGRIEITGDLATAQDVQSLINKLDIDAEELLSKFVGDVMAHQIGHVVSKATRKTAQAAAQFEHDIVDYLAHELRAVPLRDEVEEQRRAIFCLSDDVDRAAARADLLMVRRRKS